MSKRKIQNAEKTSFLTESHINTLMNEKKNLLIDQMNENIINTNDKKKLTDVKSLEMIKCQNFYSKNGSNKNINSSNIHDNGVLSTDDSIISLSDTDLTTSKSQLDESHITNYSDVINNGKQLLATNEYSKFSDIIRNLPTMTHRERVLYWKTSDQVSDVEDYTSFTDKYKEIDSQHKELTKQKILIQQSRNSGSTENLYLSNMSRNVLKKRKKLIKKYNCEPDNSINIKLPETKIMDCERSNDNNFTPPYTCYNRKTLTEPFRRKQSDSYVHKKYDLINNIKAIKSTSTCTKDKVNNTNVSDNKSSTMIRYNYTKKESPAPLSSTLQSISTNLNSHSKVKIDAECPCPEINTNFTDVHSNVKQKFKSKSLFKIPTAPRNAVPQKRKLLNSSPNELNSKSHNGMHLLNGDNSMYYPLTSLHNEIVKPIENAWNQVGTSSKIKKGDSNRDEFYKYLGIGSKSQSDDSKNENTLNDERSKRRSLRVRLQKMNITVIENSKDTETHEDDIETKNGYSYVERSPKRLIVLNKVMNKNNSLQPCRTNDNPIAKTIPPVKSCLIKYTYVKESPNLISITNDTKTTSDIQVKLNSITSPLQSSTTKPKVSSPSITKDNINASLVINKDNCKLHEKNANEMNDMNKDKQELGINKSVIKTYNGRKSNLLKNKENSICDSTKLKPINVITEIQSPKVNTIDIIKRRYKKCKVNQVNHYTRSSRNIRNKIYKKKLNTDTILLKKPQKAFAKNVSPKLKNKRTKVLPTKSITEKNNDSKLNYTDSNFVNTEWFTDEEDENVKKLTNNTNHDSPSNCAIINTIDKNSCEQQMTTFDEINIDDKITDSIVETKIPPKTNLEPLDLTVLNADVITIAVKNKINNKSSCAIDLRITPKPNEDSDLITIPIIEPLEVCLATTSIEAVPLLPSTTVPPLPSTATAPPTTATATATTSINSSAGQMLNPIKEDHGPVLTAYYTKEILIIVQKKLISYWKYSKIVSIIGASQTWELIDQIVRQDKDIEIETPYDNRLCYNNDKPVYLEFRAKESPSNNIRECIICFVYINIYYLSNSLNDSLTNLININNNNNNNNTVNNPSNIKVKKCDKYKVANDNYKLKMCSVQLDTIWGSSSTICYTTLPNSCYFVMSWTDAKRSGVCKYCLTPDLCSLASISEFPCLSHEVLRLQSIDDLKLAGIGKTALSMWDYTTGDLLISIDLEIKLGSNLSCYLFNEKNDNYIFLMQLLNTTDDNKVMKLFAIHVAAESSESRTVHTVRTLDIPPTCKTLLSSFNSNNFFVATFKEGDILLTTLNTQQSVIVSNEKNITITHNGYIIEIGKYLTLKTISEYLLEIAIR